MIFSKYNIISKIKESPNYFIVNILSGNADIISPEEARKFELLKNSTVLNDMEFIQELEEKGYLTDEVMEKKLYKAKYLDFLDARDTDEIQLFFVPNYTCNFACAYCYQDEYAPVQGKLSTEVVDSFFRYIDSEFEGRRKYITIFGGEPLLSSPEQRKTIGYFMEKAETGGLEVCVVTNGYTLGSYTEILKKARIREIQVTLDGTEKIHDARRFLKNGSATFTRISEGIDACLENHMPVNLRMVVDRENLDNLPELAAYAIEKGWTKSPLFKTQIGRNYELHHCQSAPDKLFSRITLYEKIYQLTRNYPHILEFYRPAYSVSKFLAENGSLPDPLFDACPACKTEWAFDYTGSVYSCTAIVGKAGEKLGTFYPEKSLKKDMVKEWQNRDVYSIPECRECNLQLACGGGCGSVAKNLTGTVKAPDCRPVKELLELGFSEYFELQN